MSNTEFFDIKLDIAHIIVGKGNPHKRLAEILFNNRRSGQEQGDYFRLKNKSPKKFGLFVTFVLLIFVLPRYAKYLFLCLLCML